MIIRKLKFKDILKIYRIYKNSSKKTKEFFQPRLMSNIFYFFVFFIVKKITCFVCLNNKELIGFVYITHLKTNVLGIMVKESYQNKGIGKKLMETILKNQQDVHLSSREDNKNAIKLYKKFGFQPVYKTVNMKLKKSIRKNKK